MNGHVTKVGYQLFTEQKRNGGLALVDLDRVKCVR